MPNKDSFWVSVQGNPPFFYQQGYDEAMAQYNTNLTAYNQALKDYNQALEKWNKPVPPTVNHSADTGQKIIDIRNALADQIKFLTTPPPDGPGQNKSNPGTLANQLQSVVDGIDKAFGNTTGATLSPNQLDGGSYNWLMDGRTDTVGAGTYGNQIAQAIAGSTSFNDTQRDKFNSVKNTSDQIYTIAAAVMKTLSDTIVKFGDNAGR
jgi:hypothetical protein